MLYKPQEQNSFYRISKVLEPIEAIRKFGGQENNLVFVSGVFDLLHLGHISFLRSAKEVGGEDGKLMVVLHGDEIIQQKKGEGRPLMKINERIELLSELECVDFVVEWEGWEDIVEFSKSLKPRYFAVTEKSYEHSRKGKWYGDSWDRVAEDINSEVVRIPLNRDYSSSKYLAQLTIDI